MEEKGFCNLTWVWVFSFQLGKLRGNQKTSQLPEGMHVGELEPARLPWLWEKR